MGIGDVVFGTLKDWAKTVVEAVIGWLKPSIMNDVKTEVAAKSIDPDMFQTKEVKQSVVELKDALKHSPDDISDMAGNILNVVIGKAAMLQFQGVTDQKVDAEMPLSSKLFDQMAIVTDVCLLANILSIIGQCVPLTQLTDLGREIRAYLDYSGLTQITGFGYGMMLSAALAPKITQEVDAKMQNTPLDPRDVVNLRYRDEMKDDTFYDRMALRGYSPTNADYMRKVQRPLLDPRVLTNLKHRELITSEEYDAWMRKLGYTWTNLNYMLDQSRPLLDPRILINLKHRKLIEDDDFNDRMHSLGFDDDAIARMLLEAQYFPSPGEVILWAAREIFEPAVRAKLRLDEKFPEDFKIYAMKAGMTEEMAKNFWAQHWAFPGFTTIQEMRWRNIITDADVDIFFTEADIVPYWRDAMMKVMYSPYTRVDGRRMFETGILSRDEFKTAMTDIGYTEERAEGLAKWATERKLAPQKDLTISKIEKAFRDGEITDTNYVERIKDMGYDAEEANLLLNLLKRDIEEKEEKDNVDWYILRFKNGLINLEELTTFLDGLGLNEAKKNKLILQAKNAKAALAKTATKADLDKWFKQAIIKQETYKIRLEGLGYEESDINNYVASINLEIGGET